MALQELGADVGATEGLGTAVTATAGGKVGVGVGDGLGEGTGAGLGTIGSTYLIGVVADRFSFTPILIVSSVVPLLAALLVVALVRNTKESGHGLVKAI